MSEKTKFKGRLVDKELEEKQLALKINGLVTSLRDLLDPFEEIEDLKVDMIADQAAQLLKAHIEHKNVKAKIRAIRKALGK